jgi:hypothetical protein
MSMGVSACGRHGLEGSRFGAYLTTSLYLSHRESDLKM